MHSLIVHAHPNPDGFNAALTTRARAALTAAGGTVDVADLYAEGFDPVEAARHYPDAEDPARFTPLAEQRRAYKTGRLPPTVADHIARLERADLVILQFPLWWHGMPAILKGWFDRVFVSGGLYTGRMRYDAGYFRGKRALVSVTTGAPAAAFGPGARGGDMTTMLWPVEYSLHYLGFAVLPAFAAHGVQGHGYSYEGQQTAERRLGCQLDAWAARLGGLEHETPKTFPGWPDWNADGQPLAHPLAPPRAAPEDMPNDISGGGPR